MRAKSSVVTTGGKLTFYHYDVIGGGGGGKGEHALNGENTCKQTFFVLTPYKIYMKAQKHVRFHVFSPFSAHLYPPIHHNGNGLLNQQLIHSQMHIIQALHEGNV